MVCGNELIVVVGNVGRFRCVDCFDVCCVYGFVWLLSCVLMWVIVVFIVGLFMCGEWWCDLIVVVFVVSVLVIVLWFLFRVVVSIFSLLSFCSVNVSYEWIFVLSFVLFVRLIGMCSSEYDGVSYSWLFSCFVSGLS